MRAIYRKEMRQYFHSVMGYVFLAIFMLISGFYFTMGNLLSRSGDISYFFQSIISLLMYLIPMLTMRSFAEEKKIKTEQLLFTAPVSTTEIVLGKFLAAMSVFLCGLAVTLLYPIILALFSSNTFIGALQNMFWETLGNYLAIILLVGAFVAIGIFISAITENQVVAAVLSYVVLFGLWVSSSMAVNNQNEVMGAILTGISLFIKYYEMTMGVFNPASILFYITLIFVFLFLTVRVLERRRWS